MTKHLHLFRRGNVFHWRRRLPSQSTKIDMLQLSLRTTELAEACILARRLTVESDRMFEQIRNTSLPIPEARAWLQHIIATEIAKIRACKWRAKMDPIGPPGSDRRADWATAQAWQVMAEHGLGADLADGTAADLLAQGFCDADLSALDTALVIEKKLMMSEAWMNRTARAFQSFAQRDQRPSANEMLYLRHLSISGKAAAWAQAERPELQPEAALALQFANKIVQDMAANDAVTFFGAEHLQGAQSPSAETNRATTTAPAMLEAAAAITVSPPIATELTPTFDSALLAVTGRILEDKKQNDVSDATLKQFSNSAYLFLRITGIGDVREIRKPHMARFRDVMRQLPKTWGKSPKDRDASIAEILERTEGLPAEQIGLSVPTINRHLDVMKAILERADDEGIAIDTKVQPGKLRLRDKERPMDKRAAFALVDVKKVFSHSIWTGCHSAESRHEVGAKIIKDAHFWVPIIAAYTGARREEIAGLALADIAEEDGIAFFHFTSNENRGLKTAAAQRRVPIHEQLIALGFLDHIEKARRAKQRDLFPELRPKDFVKGGSKKFGSQLQYAWERTLDLMLDGNPRAYCFHSLRHYANNLFLNNPAVPQTVRLDVIGHEAADTNMRVYREPSPLALMRDAINSTLPVVYRPDGGHSG